jgi:hypothetical protein
MKRRALLTGLSGLAATSLIPSFAMAEEGVHPMERLLNIETGRNFQFDESKFNLVIVMTAQKSYEDCGAMLIGMIMIMRESELRNKIRPIVIMPRVADQTSGGADKTNLNSAYDSECPFEILSGSLADVKNAVSGLDGAYLEYNAHGKVNGHTQNAFFLAPSGNMLLTHPAADNFTLVPLIGNIIDRCDGWFPNQDLCR